jgi:hypothetical protein
VERRKGMNKKYFLKTTLIILIFSIFALGLTGCIDIVIPSDTGAVRVTISGTYRYDILVDGVTKLSNKTPGTYTISNIPTGYRTIEAIDIDGESYGYASKTIYVSTGTTNVYLDPAPTAITGTVYIVVSGNEKYNIKMDDLTKFTNVSSGTHTLYNVSTGEHFFEAIDTWGASFGYDSETKYISSGSNYVYLYP